VIPGGRWSPDCSARATAQRGQQRTAGLIPDWLGSQRRLRYTPQPGSAVEVFSAIQNSVDVEMPQTRRLDRRAILGHLVRKNRSLGLRPRSIRFRSDQLARTELTLVSPANRYLSDLVGCGRGHLVCVRWVVERRQIGVLDPAKMSNSLWSRDASPSPTLRREVGLAPSWWPPATAGGPGEAGPPGPRHRGRGTPASRWLLTVVVAGAVGSAIAYAATRGSRDRISRQKPSR
jgi:hypothetical protein